jgi:hypothetical protein
MIDSDWELIQENHLQQMKTAETSNIIEDDRFWENLSAIGKEKEKWPNWECEHGKL